MIAAFGFPYLYVIKRARKLGQISIGYYRYLLLAEATFVTAIIK
jgi:hypothetical protein